MELPWFRRVRSPWEWVQLPPGSSPWLQAASRLPPRSLKWVDFSSPLRAPASQWLSCLPSSSFQIHFHPQLRPRAIGSKRQPQAMGQR